MIVEDQSEIVAFLSRGQSYGAPDLVVERIDTHAAHVFLAGGLAYKLKRAVRFPFLDFGTAAKRREACLAELSLNRRGAPQIYRAVAAVTRASDGGLAIDGAGAAIDWLVVMNRFDQDQLLDRLAARAELTPTLMRDLADAIAEFHRQAERRPDKGGQAGIAKVIDGNLETLAGEAGPWLDQGRVARLGEAWRERLLRHQATLESRRQDGYVRWCHGDLHLANIVRIDHRPVLFDGIEFSADIACVDVFYDLAFLLMDLQHRGLRGLANLVLNRYLARSDDFAGVGLLALFQSLRAGVRAMVNALEADESEARAQTARAYLDDALAFLSPADPVLIAVGGLSGTGKSTLAAALAPAVGAAPGAVALRSDVIRKRLFAVAPEAPLPQSAYRPEVSARVYERQRRLAAEILAAGHAVIADAVFARPEERAAIEAVAASARVRFHGLWLEAPLPVMIDRVGGRRDDASDATAEVVWRQSGYETGTIAWRRLDAAGSLAQLSRAARDCLGLPGAA